MSLTSLASGRFLKISVPVPSQEQKIIQFIFGLSSTAAVINLRAKQRDKEGS